MERILKSGEGGDHQVISVAEVQLLPWPVSANFLQPPQDRRGRKGPLQTATSALSPRASASRIGHPCPCLATPMTTAPQVSFCIPTYNRCRYLASLLESLVTQLADFPFSFELVIADNGSTDATAETIAAYADRLPIRALRHAG